MEVMLDYNLIVSNTWSNDQAERWILTEWLIVTGPRVWFRIIDYHGSHLCISQATYTYQNIIDQRILIFGFAVIAFPIFHIPFPVFGIWLSRNLPKKCLFYQQLIHNNWVLLLIAFWSTFTTRPTIFSPTQQCFSKVLPLILDWSKPGFGKHKELKGEWSVMIAFIRACPVLSNMVKQYPCSTNSSRSWILHSFKPSSTWRAPVICSISLMLFGMLSLPHARSHKQLITLSFGQRLWICAWDRCSVGGNATERVGCAKGRMHGAMESGSSWEACLFFC